MLWKRSPRYRCFLRDSPTTGEFPLQKTSSHSKLLHFRFCYVEQAVEQALGQVVELTVIGNTTTFIWRGCNELRWSVRFSPWSCLSQIRALSIWMFGVCLGKEIIFPRPDPHCDKKYSGERRGPFFLTWISDHMSSKCKIKLHSIVEVREWISNLTPHVTTVEAWEKIRSFPHLTRHVINNTWPDFR